MATFNINLGKLNELQSSLDSSNKKFSGINDQFFTKINKVNTLWNDPNTEVFLNQLKSDKNKIDQYNENAKKLNDAIYNFINSLVSVARKCNSSANGNFNYNGTQAKNMVNNCISAYDFSQNVKSKLSYIDIPTTFKYRGQLKNMKYQIMDINDRLKRITNDLNDVVSSIEKAFDNIQNAPRIDTLNLRQMDYISQTESVELTSSAHIVDEAKAKESLEAKQGNVKYNEQDSTFQNNSQNQIYSEKHNDFEEADSTFVSRANRETPQDSAVIFEETDSTFVNQSSRETPHDSTVNFEEEDSTFQNNSQTQTYSEKTNDFQEIDSTFKNSGVSTSAQNNSINVDNNLTFDNNVDTVSYNDQNNEFERTTSNFSNSAKTVSTSNNKVSFTQTNTELNVPNETRASSSDININTTSHFESTTRSVDANDIKVEVDKVN